MEYVLSVTKTYFGIRAHAEDPQAAISRVMSLTTAEIEANASGQATDVTIDLGETKKPPA